MMQIGGVEQISDFSTRPSSNSVMEIGRLEVLVRVCAVNELIDRVTEG